MLCFTLLSLHVSVILSQNSVIIHHSSVTRDHHSHFVYKVMGVGGGVTDDPQICNFRNCRKMLPQDR